ncbi:unnamed protein product [Oreochromis niloticus]|nr:unnamed protein product [Mustela putorius furo]
MPSLSTDDYHSLLQKISVLETKIHRLEVNVEVNGLCGNETTLPLIQSNGDDQASTQLRSTDNMTKKVDSVHYYKSSSENPPLDCLGAKPRHKSCLLEGGGHITGRAQRAEISETDWPSLPTRQRSSSTPVYGRKQDWTTANRKVNNKPPKQLNVKLQNRFAPLSKDPASISDNHPSKSSEVRSENLLKSKRPQGKLKARPETLIVGDSAIKDVQRMCGKNTKVLCFPKDMVNNLKERILQIADEYPTVTNIVLHTGSNDVSKQQSEVLKRDFTGLLNTVNSLNAAVFISGPVPPVRGGDERFIRLFALNKWLISACTDHSVHFINNFNIFWERRHLFKANGFNFNKSGVKLFTSNLFYSIRHPSVLGAKAEINEELSHKEEQTVLQEQTKPSRNLEEELHLPPPGKSLRKERHLRQEEGSLFASNSLNNTNDQDQGPRPSPVPQTPDRSSPSSPSLSPSSPHLKFTEEMMERVNAGLRSTPRPNPFLSLINPPPEQPKVRHRAPPSTEQSKLHCAASPPLVPPYHLHALSPQSDV